MDNFLVKISLSVDKLFSHDFLWVFVAIVLISYLLSHKYIAFKKFLISFGLTGGLIIVLKELIKVPRPDNAVLKMNDYAFPSGHTGLSFFLATFFIYQISKSRLNIKLKFSLYVILIIFAIFVGVSRLILQVHTLDQVLVGAMIGVIVPIVVLNFNFFKNK